MWPLRKSRAVQSHLPTRDESFSAIEKNRRNSIPDKSEPAYPAESSRAKVREPRTELKMPGKESETFAPADRVDSRPLAMR
jgi:hypothetical protein